MIPPKVTLENYNRLTIDRLSDEGCLNLLEMFLSLLSEDYRYMLKLYICNQSDPKTRKSFKKIRGLILSDYFALLTGIDGRDVIGTLDGKYRSALEGFDV